jgi:outer membrane biosynthesis protein TonB
MPVCYNKERVSPPGSAGGSRGTMKRTTAQKSRWRTIHGTTLLSLGLHILLLILIIIAMPKGAKIAAEHFQIVVVSDENDLDLIKERQAVSGRTLDREKGALNQMKPPSNQAADTPPPPLPPPAYPTQAPPLPQITSGATGKHEPPPLPLSAEEQGTTTMVNPLPGEGREEPGDGKGPPINDTENLASNPGEEGPGAGEKRVSAFPMEGNKLFILPPRDESLPIRRALRLCEGLTPREEAVARKIEFRVSLESNGQPSEIELTRSCGDKKLDEEVKNLMNLMRFDTGTVKSLSSCYLTLVIVGGKPVAKGDKRP